jgi:hypothetical protein
MGEGAARPKRMALGWRIWVAGLAVPAAEVALIAYPGGTLSDEYPVSVAPGAIHTLLLLGTLTLLISACLREGSPALALLSGIAGVGGLAALAAGVSALIFLPGALLAASMGLSGLIHGTGPFPEAALLIAMPLLVFLPFWTAYEVLRFARRLWQSAADGILGGLASPRAALGAVFAFAALAGAEIAHRHWISSRIDRLSQSASPDEWRVALGQLKAYPLCGRFCRMRVCGQIFMQFPSIRRANEFGGSYDYVEIAPAYVGPVSDFLGPNYRDYCWR